MVRLPIEPSTAATDVADLTMITTKAHTYLYLSNPKIPSSWFFWFPSVSKLNRKETNLLEYSHALKLGSPRQYFSMVQLLKRETWNLYLRKNLVANSKRYSTEFIHKQIECVREREMKSVVMHLSLSPHHPYLKVRAANNAFWSAYCFLFE